MPTQTWVEWTLHIGVLHWCSFFFPFMWVPINGRLHFPIIHFHSCPMLNLYIYLKSLKWAFGFLATSLVCWVTYPNLSRFTSSMPKRYSGGITNKRFGCCDKRIVVIRAHSSSANVRLHLCKGEEASLNNVALLYVCTQPPFIIQVPFLKCCFD